MTTFEEILQDIVKYLPGIVTITTDLLTLIGNITSATDPATKAAASKALFAHLSQ